jgi:hypothetical protein
MKPLILDVIAGLTGLALAGLFLHNPGSVTGLTAGVFKDASTAVNVAGTAK